MCVFIANVINQMLEKLPSKNFEYNASMVVMAMTCFGSAFIDNPAWALLGVKLLDSCITKYNLSVVVFTTALIYGIYAGGITTIFGSMPNIAASELCNYYNFKFSFVEYSKLAIPMCILMLLLSAGSLRLYIETE